jgi:hypothetical protein
MMKGAVVLTYRHSARRTEQEEAWTRISSLYEVDCLSSPMGFCEASKAEYSLHSEEPRILVSS